MKQRDIFWFWLPLFASWLLMTAEGPVISAAINRLPNAIIMLAAQGIVMSLSVTIESPIINLLATSTALVKDRASYLLLRRFAIHWMIGLTLLTILVSFTVLFDWLVVGLLNVPLEVAEWIQPGMQIMTLWSAAIAWRRFTQGVLIRYKRTRMVAWGTVVRIISSAGVVVGLALLTDLPGVITGSTALVVGVIAEALFASWAVQPILRNELGVDSPAAKGDPLTYSELFWFHLPLAATSALTLMVQPLVAFSLARLENPTESLAAWPLVFQVMLMTRAAAFALPEVVIAMSAGEPTFAPLRRFAFTLSAALSLFMLAFIATPLMNFYLGTVQNAPEIVIGIARGGLSLMLLFPGLTTLIFWLRGLLTYSRATKAINAGMAVNLTVTAVILFTGLWLRLPGLETAAVALVTAAGLELIYLWRGTRKLIARPLLDLPFTQSSAKI